MTVSTACDDAMITEVTAGIERMDTIDNNKKPLDVVSEAGPPADPIPFPSPVLERGKRADVLCYNKTTQGHDVARNVLFRDYSREYGEEGGLHHVQRAYWSVPYKEPIKTIMGHVQICVVLRRLAKDQDDDDSENDSENDDEDGGEDDEDIVFQMTEEYVAIKVNYCARMEKLRNSHAEDPMKEIAAMQLIGDNHPHVLGCREVLYDGENINVVLPYCRDGDLFELLQVAQRQTTPGMPEPQARYWFRQILSGLQHLHAKGICHRDLSPENVMIDQHNCLIIDMGMCIRIPYTDPNSSSGSGVTDIFRGTSKRLLKPQGTCGKLPYMSPEIYRNKQAFDGGAVDVWTAGTILFCMLTGNRSYQRAHESDPQFYWMTHGLTMLLADWNVQLSPEGVDLLQGLLQIDPRERFTLSQAQNHPWFLQPDEKPPSLL